MQSATRLRLLSACCDMSLDNNPAWLQLACIKAPQLVSTSSDWLSVIDVDLLTLQDQLHHGFLCSSCGPGKDTLHHSL